MMNHVKVSPALDTRVASLRARMRDARLTAADMKAFQKVATIMSGDSGAIDGDDLIAASFVLDQPDALESVFHTNDIDGRVSFLSTYDLGGLRTML
jgi:hypothetical protein